MSTNRHRVLVVDDDERMRDMVIAAMCETDDLEVVGQACDGVEAIEAVDRLHPDVVIMDVDMPRMDGARAAESILLKHPDVRIVAFTGHVESASITRMIVAGAVGYAVKRGDPQSFIGAVRGAAGHSTHLDPAAIPGLFQSVVELARDERTRRREAERLHDELEQSYEDTIQALANALRSRDHSTQEHVDRVTGWALAVGRKVGLGKKELRDLEYGAVFHDIGKIGIPDSILQNTDDLTDSEWDIIKQHTVMGEQIIQPVGFLRDVATIVRHSHEHWDGSGYPDGLKGEEIPLSSRIVLVCDAYDAMTSDRSYQDAMGDSQAEERLKELSGTHFDPKIVELLLEAIHEEHGAAASTGATDQAI